ncbi:MAG TPA: PRC-barrel domain-containing protein [Solirubrobacteraceae bacterium]|nr:PRC-barrel domain-containing protein [Solirubrobacteraceae bacterium]
MRATELLACRVVDARGADLGPLRDVRVRLLDGAFEVTALVVGGGRFAGLAHATGVAEGRVQGPWLLRRLCRDAVEAVRVAPADAVAEWGPGTIRLAVPQDELERPNR